MLHKILGDMLHPSPDVGPVHPRGLPGGYEQLVGVNTHAPNVLGVTCSRCHQDVNNGDEFMYLDNVAGSDPPHYTEPQQLPQSRSSHLGV